MRKNKLTALFIACFVAAASFTGCGSASDTSDTSTADAGSGETTAAGDETTADSDSGSGDFSELEEKFDKLQAEPKFEFEAEKFDAKSVVKGQKWRTIPASSGNPFNEDVCEIMRDTAKDLFDDFSIDIYENQGGVDEYISGIESAKSSGYNLVDLFAGPTPTSLSSQIQESIDNGVPVITSHLTDVDQKVSPISANMGGNYKEAGELLADWAIMKSGKDANVVALVAEEIDSTLAMEDGIKQEFEKYAPDGKYKFVNVPLADWSTDVQPNTEGALSSDPDVDYVIAIYDSMTQYIVPAIQSTGSKAKVIGFNGTPFAIDYVNTGEVELDIGEDLGWIAYTIMDYEMRYQAGMDLPDPKCAFRAWTKDNVKEALGDDGKAAYSIGYGDAYIDGYKKLWELE